MVASHPSDEIVHVFYRYSTSKFRGLAKNAKRKCEPADQAKLAVEDTLEAASATRDSLNSFNSYNVVEIMPECGASYEKGVLI